MKEVLKKVLSRITPSDEERVMEKKIAQSVMDRLSRFKVKPILVGSLAKGTDLRGDKDLDIFIAFPTKTKREELERRGLAIGKKVLGALGVKFEIDYAEHPYVKGVYKNYEIEIVPCYSGKKILSSVDRTPFHTQYVKKKLKKNKALAGEIRLLKQFMKAHNVYGAEAKVQGFSGYLTELLVLHYGSFVDALKATSNWKFGESIDPEKQWGREDDLRYLFTDASLILVDPVDKDRNVAAAVSRQKLAEFMVASLEFLKGPNEEFFFPKDKKPKSKKELTRIMGTRGSKLIALLFKHGKINQNSLYSQLRRTNNALIKEIRGFGFKVFKSDIWTDEMTQSAILLEFEIWELPKVMHHLGPPIDRDIANQETFRQKYAKDEPYIKDGRWVVDTKRKYKTIDELIPKILMERRGFGKNLRGVELKKVEGKKILNIGGKEFLRFMSGFL